MYGFVQYTANRFVAFPTLKECLKHARLESVRQYKKEPKGTGDTGIFRFPKNAVNEIYVPKYHVFTDYGMECYVGMVWTSNSFTPQYQVDGANYSRDIMADGSLGPVGWRAPPRGY